MTAYSRKSFLHAALAGLLLPGAASAAGVNAYIPNFADATVSVVDTGTNTVTATITMLGTFPEGIAVTPDGTKVLIGLRAGTSGGNTGDGALEILDTASNAVIAQIPTEAGPVGIVTSPDSKTGYVVHNNFDGTPNLWAIDLTTNKVKSQVSINVAGQAPFTVTISPDGAKLYIVSSAGSGGGPGILQVFDIATSTAGSPVTLGDDAQQIVMAPDGQQVYVTNLDDNTVSVVSTATNTVTATIPVGGRPFGIGILPDGSQVWVANVADGTISAISTATNKVTSTFPAGNGVGPAAIGFTQDGTTAYVPDGGMSTGDAGNTVSVIDVASHDVTATVTVGNLPTAIGNFIGTAPATPPAAALLSAVLPGSRSVETDTPATIFATMLNTSSAPLDNCLVALPSSAPSWLSLAYQTTDATTNAPTGQANTPVTIPAGGSQSFVLTFNGFDSGNLPGLPLVFSCYGVAQAATTTGLNTVDLLYADSAIPDIIALEATATPGVLEVPSGGSAAFAVATDNFGADGTLTVGADTGNATLPLSIAFCQTNPATGTCIAAPSSTLTLDFAAGATPTFSFFVTASGAISFDPANSRIFVRFKDSDGNSHGSTGVAVETN